MFVFWESKRQPGGRRWQRGAQDQPVDYVAFFLLVRVTWFGSLLATGANLCGQRAGIDKTWSPFPVCSSACNAALQAPKYLPKLHRAKSKTRDMHGGFSFKRGSATEILDTCPPPIRRGNNRRSLGRINCGVTRLSLSEKVSSCL